MKRELQDSITIKHAIEVLNEALKMDREAIASLIQQRVLCNKEMADHPTIQVSANKEKEEYRVGFLGVLNGLFGIAPDGYGAIAANFEVNCPNGHETSEKAKINQPCPICGELLVLGKIIAFQQIREAK